MLRMAIYIALRAHCMTDPGFELMSEAVRRTSELAAPYF